MVKSDIQEFSAHWSISTWVMTIIMGTIVFGFIPFKCIKYYMQSMGDNNAQNLFSILIPILVILVFVLAFFLAPRKYIVTDSQIIVVRLGPNVILPIRDINEVQHVSRRKLKFIIRLFGVGGFCGMYGICYSSTIGLFEAYITNSTKLILIKYRDFKKILLSPESPEEFLNLILQNQDNC